MRKYVSLEDDEVVVELNKTVKQLIANYFENIDDDTLKKVRKKIRQLKKEAALRKLKIRSDCSSGEL